MGEEMAQGFVEDFIPPLRWWPTKKFSRFLSIVYEFNDFIGEQFQKHKESFDPNNIEDLTDNILLAHEQARQEDSMAEKFTYDHARHIVIDVFGAGVDTSRHTLDWLFLVLVAYPEVQKKMQEEIDRVVGT
ncbi:cytochrome P450 1A1 [Elysia marginata]|uniref:Cytochrome P450 1A1 n=1 Tax=Elysia marginata TaxID=1093978 RepID=A0AAV4F120_9GAST|nr:cytochrome P450 1A1 [Elysia marginata]